MLPYAVHFPFYSWTRRWVCWYHMPCTLPTTPNTADGPIAWPAELRGLINRGNLADHTMGCRKRKLETIVRYETGDKGRCSVHCPSPPGPAIRRWWGPFRSSHLFAPFLSLTTFFSPRPTSRRHAILQRFQAFHPYRRCRSPGDCSPVQRNRGRLGWPRVYPRVCGK